MGNFTTTLIEVDDDGELLEMADGTLFEIEPADTPTVILWVESAQIEISLSPGTAWTHVLVNRSNGQKVRAVRTTPQ